jgi:hypothetical protein
LVGKSDLNLNEASIHGSFERASASMLRAIERRRRVRGSATAGIRGWRSAVGHSAGKAITEAWQVWVADWVEAVVWRFR